MRVMDDALDADPHGDAGGHLAAAAAARAGRDVESMRAALVAAFAAARAAGDGEAMAAAALAMPTSQRFGVYPGQIPALLHEAYVTADAVATRARLARATPGSVGTVMARSGLARAGPLFRAAACGTEQSRRRAHPPR